MVLCAHAYLSVSNRGGQCCFQYAFEEFNAPTLRVIKEDTNLIYYILFVEHTAKLGAPPNFVTLNEWK
jgi:hypothetical protein